MNPTTTQNAIWFIETVGFFAVALQVVARGQRKRWPSLFVYCVVHVLGTILLAASLRHYSAYFWIFWIRELMLAAVRIWMLADLIRSIPAGEYIPRIFHVVGLTCASVVCFGAVSIAAHGSHPVTTVEMILLLNKCATVAWAGALIVVLLSVGLSGFGFHPQPVRIGCGYLVTVVAGMIAAHVYASERSMALKLSTNEAAGCVSIAVLCYWFFALSMKDGFVSLSDLTGHEFEVLDKALFTTAERNGQ